MFLKSVAIRLHDTKSIRRRLVIDLFDLTAFAVSAFCAFQLRFDGELPSQYFASMQRALCIWAAAKLVCFIAGGLSRGSWQQTSLYDTVWLILANTAGSILGGVVIVVALGPWAVPRSVYILDWLLSCLITLGGRMVVRVVANRRRSNDVKGERVRTLIYGAGAAGLALLWELEQNQALMCNVIGFIDDDRNKLGLALKGKPVMGAGDALHELVRKHGIQRVLIAIPSATGAQIAHILKLTTDEPVEYKMVPSLGELVQGTDLGKQIRGVSVEDLLGREPVSLDLALIRARIQGKTVMVTGAAGSIGSEICRQIAHFSPRAIIGFDEAETPLFHIDREMRRKFHNVAFYPEIGSITRPDTLQRVMKLHGPSILYHAAAYKHVPMMEKNVFSAVETNIFGTWNVACAASECGVEDFVMISTDKAVRPTSMMGATKRTAELLIRALQTKGGTKFVAVRFGNVLGSNGSVVPIFKEQIAAGGPVTVTDPEMRRYFMTIPEAAQLVLQAFSIGKGGEVFVLEMGEAVRIVDLARNLILLSGLQPGRDIEIRYTGLRPGEKLFEELNLQDEHMIRTSHPKIRSYVRNHDPDVAQIKAMLYRLQEITREQDVARLVILLKELIPDYNPSAQLLQTALSSKIHHPRADQIPVAHAQTETSVVTNLAPAAMMN